MKKQLLSILLMFLPIMAMGQSNNASIVLHEKDFTGITEFTYWAQFAESQTDGKVEVDPDGVAITVGIQTGQLWQPQVMVIPDGSFDLEYGDYKVVVTAKFPTDGTLQINMGSWSANDEATFPIKATGDFQEVVCEFKNWSVVTEGAHLLFDVGDFKGTTILKKIKVIGAAPTPYDPANICYNYIAKGKVAEVISNPNLKYRGIVEIPSKVTHEGVEYTVTKIADRAFSGCTKLGSVTIPNSVTNIGESAFSGCSGLPSITIPNSVTSIGEGAFSGCSSLPSITIPNNVTSIGKNAFSGCSSLTSVTIGNSVTSIGDNAFSGCSSLTSVTIGNSVTSIGAYAFQSCSDLSSVTIGNSVRSIEACAFRYCISLTSVTIPNSVTSIGGSTFMGCSGLTSITIPNSVTSIGGSSFKDCSNLTSVTLLGMSTEIYNQAFANCMNLTDFYCLAEKMRVPSVGPDGLDTSSDAFQDSYPQYITLHVPASAINVYKTTAPWSGFKEIVPISGEEMKKCSTPTISIENGKVKFNCGTEGAEFVSSISAPDAKSYNDSELTLSYKFKVSVYATKNGYVNSDTATFEITASGIFGDLTGDGVVNVADHVELSNIIMNQNK